MTIQNDNHNEEPQPSRRHDEWTPLHGILSGTTACVVVSAILAAGFCTIAYYNPLATIAQVTDGVRESLGSIIIGSLVGFVMAWILFAVMHRVSQLVGGLCPVIVLVMAILIVVAKQLVLVAYGADTNHGFVQGWAWMKPATFLTSNLGIWLGLIAAIAIFKEGMSLSELFN